MNRTSTKMIVICLAVLCGCSIDDAKPERTQRKHWQQTCEMCGAKWSITTSDQNKTVPPTVEWCFHDGSICEDGLNVLIEINRAGENEINQQKWVDHCVRCKGCRCATFTPDEWRNLTEKRYRQSYSY